MEQRFPPLAWVAIWGLPAIATWFCGGDAVPIFCYWFWAAGWLTGCFLDRGTMGCLTGPLLALVFCGLAGMARESSQWYQLVVPAAACLGLLAGLVFTVGGQSLVALGFNLLGYAGMLRLLSADWRFLTAAEAVGVVVLVPASFALGFLKSRGHLKKGLESTNRILRLLLQVGCGLCVLWVVLMIILQQWSHL